MAITWSNILTWETRPLDSVAADLLEASQGLRQAYEDGETALNAVQSQGGAVTAMRETTTSNLASLERALTNVNGALMAIEAARDGVGEVLAQINSALTTAAERQCTIEADGSVHPNESVEDIPEAHLIAEALADAVKKILEYADRVDTDLYHALADINNDRYTDGDGADNKVVGVPDFPQPNWSPSQNAAWWNSLSYEQQQFLIDRRPDDIRHLDGLPAQARDKANKHALDGYLHADGTYRVGAFEESKAELSTAMEEYDQAKKEYFKAASETSTSRIPAGLRAKFAQADARLKAAQEAYDDLSAIRRQTNDTERAKSGLPPAYLLDFDYDRKFKRTTAIVSSGNPDTATHVSTFVPGIGTNVRDSLGMYMDINERIKQQTAHVGVNPNNVATISYLGYVAPRNDGWHVAQAAFISYADRAAPKLAQFEEGLRASANANGHTFTNTLLTHSYGSTTGGKSATLTAPGTVDRLILTGSPGSGVHSIDEYNVPKEHVYVSAVPMGDAVEGLGFDSSYGTDPRELDGITHLSGDASDAKGYWHPLPADADAETRSKDILSHLTANHMSYFEEGTRTSQDFANIIAGGNRTTDEEWLAMKAARRK